MEAQEVVLQVEGITKRFPGVLANHNVNLTLHRGEILAMLGENGAGKTTLMNIIYGLYHPDEGTIRVKGHEVHFASPREAIHSGIGMVHQHFQLIPVMTVAENVILGAEETVSDRARQDRVAVEDTPVAGTIRVIWGAFWRLFGPVLSILLGLLVAQVALLLIMAISVHLVSGPELETIRFGQLPILEQGQIALNVFHRTHPTLTGIFLWIPAALGALVAALCIVLGLRYALRTWRGRSITTEHPARLDGVIDAVIDLFTTWSAVQARNKASQRVHELSQKYGLEVNPDAYVEKLPVGTQQRVEIVKALYRHADILILDEPTAVLTPQEAQELFKIMRDLASQGVSIIFITHKLKEVLAVSDNIVVMRGGEVVGTAKPGESTEASLASMMVGRTVMLRVAKTPAKPGAVVLSVSDLRAKDDRGSMVLDGVGFEVCEGEVLGIAGVQGNGQTELVEVLTGLRESLSGSFTIAGKPYTHSDPRHITMAGTAHIPEDRQRYGMVQAFPVSNNLVLNRYYMSPFAAPPTAAQLPFVALAYAALFSLSALVLAGLWQSSLWPAVQNILNLDSYDPKKFQGPFLQALLITLVAILIAGGISHVLATLILNQVGKQLQKRNESGGLTINKDAIMQNADQLIKEFDIRTPSPLLNAGNLSGGNQQKMVVAREFVRHPHLLIASQPTRGIDVGSIEFIHQRIIKQRDEGAAVLLVSAELDEIMALSDRIAVMYKGQIIDSLPADSATREQLGLLMAGIKPQLQAETA